MNTFNLSVVSPEKKILDGQFNSLTIATGLGEITVLPHHSSLFATIKPGQVVTRNGSQETALAVTGGFISVHNNYVQLLVDFGIKSDEIDRNIVAEAKKRAEETIAKGEKLDPASIDARAELIKALVQLQVAEKRSRHRS